MEDPSAANQWFELVLGPDGVTPGIIDRLERDNDDRLSSLTTKLVASGPSFEKAQERVHFTVCRREFDRRNRATVDVRQMSQTITARPSSKTISFTEQRLTAVHRAILQVERRVRTERVLCVLHILIRKQSGDPQLALVEALRRTTTSPE